MKTQLFYGPPEEFFDMEALRDLARKEVGNSSLIRRAAAGEKGTAVALHIGYWPFVSEFEKGIDRQSYRPKFLIRKFGREKFETVWSGISTVIAEMSEEEESHAKHWEEDARQLGIDVLESELRAQGVLDLIAGSYNRNLPEFFAMLAGTEFIAEELSALLTTSPKYLQLFKRRRWAWGDIHLEPHDSWSHLQIDMDLARAYHEDDAKAKGEIEQKIAETISLFGKASRDVEELFAPLVA